MNTSKYSEAGYVVAVAAIIIGVMGAVVGMG